MKFKEIFRFEIAYQLRRPYTWLFFIFVAVFAFLNTSDDTLAEALYEDFFINSPYAVAKNTVLGTMIWLISAAVIAGAAAARDVETGMHPLTYTIPVTKASYLAGRFLAAFCLNALILLAVQLGIVIGIYWSNVNADASGPFGPWTFLNSYAIISLPNAFVATALQFFLASRTGRSGSSYFGSFLLMFMGFFVGALLLYYSGLGTLLDPIGIRFVVEDLAHNWTPTEHKWRMLSLDGTMLLNRLIWTSVGIATLAVTYISFRLTYRTRRKTKKTIIDPEISGPSTLTTTIITPAVRRSFDIATQLRQTLSLGWHSFKMMMVTRTGLALAIAVPLLALITCFDQVSTGGVDRIPVTSLIVTELAAPLSSELSPWIILPLLLVIFADELVWRERDAKLNELYDTMPTTEWSMLLGKFFAMGLIIGALMILVITGGVITQLILGYREIDLGLYFKVFFGLQFVEYLLFAILVIVLHVIINQKYIAHLVAIVVSAFIAVPQMFYVEHYLLVYDSSPPWSHSEMRGFGVSLKPWIWFKLYWASWALLLLVIAKAFWARGKDLRIRQRITRSTVVIASVATILIVSTGGFIFYNTNILNKYLSKSDYATLLSDYERLYGKYKNIAQPKLASTELHIELFPEKGVADITGSYDLFNNSTQSIDSIHVATIPGARTGSINFDKDFASVLIDDLRGHRIYKLNAPLQPGDSIRLSFDVHVEPHGFFASIVPNGAFFTNENWLPSIGYQSKRELMKPVERRKNGLPKRRLLPSVYDSAARMIPDDRTKLDVVIVTSEGQTAVAPGKLVKNWKEGSRNAFHYVTEKPIGNEYSFFSANYAVHETKWDSVDIRIFYHPTHQKNVEHFATTIKSALDHNSRKFGPYQYDHLTFVEVRGNEIGMHADGTLVRFSEGTSFWDPDPQGLDLPFSVVSHETSHQWWGHQIGIAYVEGGGVLSESLAQYSAMEIMKENKGDAHFQKLLSFMHSPFPYAPIRRGEPLIRAMDPYLNYRKGPFVLYALSEHVGEAKIDSALRRLIGKHPAGHVPLATTLDLYHELQVVTPDSLQYLVRDLFEVNTLWDLNMERAIAQPNEDNTWQVTLEINARKVVVDTAGVETQVPMNDWIEIGVFGDGQLYSKKHRITSGDQAIIVTVPSKPSSAGIDPHHVLDWERREDDNNIERVKINL